MNFIPLVFICLIPLFVSCTTDSTSEDIEVLKVINAFQKNEPIFASNIVDQIEYIRLETSENSFLKGYPTVYTINDTLILVKSHKRISLFNRLNGKFLKDIGNVSQDPEGYSYSLPSLGLDESNSLIFAKGWRSDLHQYSLSTGKLATKIPKPYLASTSPDRYYADGLIPSTYAILDNQYIVAFLPNHSGNEKIRLVIYNFNGEINKTFSNNQSYKNDKGMFASNSREGIFYNFNEKLFFKEFFSDTLFHVSLDTLKPKYYFDLGKHSPPYANRQEALSESRAEYMFVLSIIENDEFLIFRLGFQNRNHMAYYDKSSGTLHIANTRGTIWNGFENDIDNFVSFFPDGINRENEIIGTTSAEQVYEWFQNNPEKINALPEHLKNLQNMKPEDNPLIMIAKIK